MAKLTWLDRFGIAFSLLLVGGGVVGFYLFPEYSLLLRTLVLVAILFLAALIFLVTGPGRAFRRFLSEVRLEMRKVVWPSRQEVMQTTLFILAFVALMGLFFWSLDAIFFWGVSLFVQS